MGSRVDRILNTETVSIASVTFRTSFGILFDNPYLISIAIISGLIGIWNAVSTLAKENNLKRDVNTYDAILKGAFVGVLSSPIVTLLLIIFVDPMLNHYLSITINDEKQIYTFALYSFLGLFGGRKVGYWALDFLNNRGGKKYD